MTEAHVNDNSISSPRIEAAAEMTEKVTRTVGQLCKVIVFGEPKPKTKRDDRSDSTKVCNVIHHILVRTLFLVAGIIAGYLTIDLLCILMNFLVTIGLVAII
jgi:hypothetical protein